MRPYASLPEGTDTIPPFEAGGRAGGGGPDVHATGRSETLTEYRIATSADHGATWTHQVVPSGSATGALGFVFPSLAGSAEDRKSVV